MSLLFAGRIVHISLIFSNSFRQASLLVCHNNPDAFCLFHGIAEEFGLGNLQA